MMKTALCHIVYVSGRFWQSMSHTCICSTWFLDVRISICFLCVIATCIVSICINSMHFIYKLGQICSYMPYDVYFTLILPCKFLLLWPLDEPDS